MPYLAKILQFQKAAIGMAYVETVNKLENIKFRQLLRKYHAGCAKNAEDILLGASILPRRTQRSLREHKLEHKI